MEKQTYPILEYDPAREAILEPSKLFPKEDIPRKCVFCFFGDVLDNWLTQGKLTQINQRRSEMGIHPVYATQYGGQTVAVFQPGVTAPFTAAMMEELIAIGVESVIACGGAGVLDGAIDRGKVIVPTSAIRDEGASYHYLSPSREIELNTETVAVIESTLNELQIPFLKGKTWTTDGIFRETPDRIRMRREEGAICVEMECSALAAVAQFRGIRFGQLLYGGDDVSGKEWNSRNWDKATGVREKLLILALETCIKLV